MVLSALIVKKGQEVRCTFTISLVFMGTKLYTSILQLRISFISALKKNIITQKQNKSVAGELRFS